VSTSQCKWVASITRHHLIRCVHKVRAVRVPGKLHLKHALHGDHQRARRGDKTDAAFLLSCLQGRERHALQQGARF